MELRVRTPLDSMCTGQARASEQSCVQNVSRPGQSSGAEQARPGQSRAGQSSGAEQARASEQRSRAGQARAEQRSRLEQSSGAGRSSEAEQVRAEQAGAEQARAAEQGCVMLLRIKPLRETYFHLQLTARFSLQCLP